MRNIWQLLWAVTAATIFLSGCSLLSPPLRSQPLESVKLATHWHIQPPNSGAPPHQVHWLNQFDDALLIELIKSGQRVSPTVGRAKALIANAQAITVGQSASLLPTLNATSTIGRGRPDLSIPLATTSALNLQGDWEIDVRGANQAAVKAAKARLEASQANWGDANISIAAEIANTYINFRSCEAKVLLSESNTNSLRKIAHLSHYMEVNGLRSESEVHYAQASASQGQLATERLRSECEIQLKALVALTAKDEDTLRRDLSAAPARLPVPKEFEISSIPAKVLAQRPDIFSSERDIYATGADFTQLNALRLPRIALSGSLGISRISGGSISTDGSIWSVGPITISLPLFDGGMRKANAEAARTRYEAAVVSYAFLLRNAVREVESALTVLLSLSERSADANSAARGYEHAFKATEIGYQNGINSIFELENARLKMISAQDTLIELSRDNAITWVALYKAVGGGWSATNIANLGNSPPSAAEAQ